MLRRGLFVLMLVGIASEPGLACSFAPAYQAFTASGTPSSDSGLPPATPAMSVLSLTRGVDDGSFASCSDAGILTIAIDDAETAMDLGFIFELESGEFPDEVLPDGIVSPVDLGNGSSGFSFVWLDLPSGRSKVAPIEVRMSARAVSPTMAEGEKVFLEIRSP